MRFVPNPKYWDKKPHLDALVYRIIPDAGGALTAYRSGQVSLLQGVPPEVTLAELQAIPDTTVETTENLAVSLVVFNTQKPPLDSVAVRQALAYATDRESLVRHAFSLLKPDIRPIQALMTPVNGRWYIEPFARYRRDLARVDQLMRGAGWARGGDGIWTKGDQRAQLDVVGLAGNKSVQLQEEILQSQWKEAGFDVRLYNVSNQADLLRRGAFHVSFTGGAFTNDDPSRCALLCSRNIPTEANSLAGENVSRVADAAHDAAWDRVNNEVDEARRMDALRSAYEITANLVPFLPTAPGISLLVYNSSRLAGIRNDGGPMGPFFGTTDWFCREGRC
jgi:peptide/nickel transport system substrate-binding protein